MSDAPFFSIVVPSYNRAAIITGTIDSILKQAFGDFEIVIVDDGSTDNSVDILEKKYGTNSKIRIYSQSNSERGAARNNGLKKSAGKFVVFFDSDDFMHEDHLEVLYNCIQKKTELSFFATKFDFRDEKGNSFSSDMHTLAEGEYDYRLFLSGNPLACNICVKKNNPDLFLFEEDRKYSIKEDWMFMMQNFRHQKLYILDKTTITMFDHSQRSMRGDNSVIIARTKHAMEWILQKIELSKDEKKQLTAHINYFCAIHSYLDHSRKQSIDFILAAIKNGGMKPKYLIFLLKAFAGRRIVKAFR